MESQGLTTSSQTKSRHNAFVRFLLKSWQPVPTWQSTIVLFFLIGLALIGFGVALIAINANIVEVTQRYDDLDACETVPGTCTVKFEVTKDMEQPIFFYYEIENFYQNHRRYINSRSSTQLAGETATSSSEIKALEDACSPVVTNADMGKTIGADGTTSLAKTTDIAIPCGLIAKSFFNDEYTLYKEDGVTNIPIDETNIAWPSDRDNKFKNPTNPVDSTKQWISMENEHFIVWMRTAGLPDFRKLWGRITVDLPVGTYNLKITNNYKVTDFEGKKSFVLSTTGPFGGKNNFLAISYLAVGGVCVAVAIFFFIRWRQYSKKNM
jgi:hypothetical protein